MRRVASTLMLLVVASCRPAFDPGSPPAIRGEIVARDVPTSIGDRPTVHIKESPDAECGIIFLITGDTRIMRRSASGGMVPASVAELAIGRRVIAWADFILDSCPGQATATALQLVE